MRFQLICFAIAWSVSMTTVMAMADRPRNMAFLEYQERLRERRENALDRRQVITRRIQQRNAARPPVIATPGFGNTGYMTAHNRAVPHPRGFYGGRCRVVRRGSAPNPANLYTGTGPGSGLIK